MLSTSTAGYDALCEATEPSPDFATDRAISATRHGLTPALGRDDERDAEVVEIRPRRIKADPRLLEGAAEIESTVLAVMKARGVTLVGPLGSDYTHEDFAKECGRNAMTGVVAAMEEVES